MSDIRGDFLELVTDVRAHIEYLKALGIKTIEIRPIERAPVHSPASGPAAAPDPKNLPSGQPKTSGLAAVREDLGECVRCKLHKGRKTIVFGEGNPDAGVVFVGEGPGFEEDEQGRPFVGEAGQLLTKIIENGMRINRSDVYICNVVKCRPPGNRNPEPDEIAACGPFLERQLLTIRPKVIVTLGNTPTQTLLKTKEGITKLRGKWRTYHGIPLMPTFHPAYLLRNPADKKLVWEDIQKVMKELEKV